jgi:NADH-quinone oxidoreductase subunit G
MTVMTGHTYRRSRFRKRTHRNQNLGPFINHEMNRCIQCYRCVRFYRGIAGGRDLNVFACHDSVYFGRHEDGALESEFSGNLVEVCPTGVFTDKTFKRHYTRKWDLQTAPSLCVHCGIGCNTIAGERYGTVRRILNRYHHQVNGYFLCDRGRFGYGFVNSNKRIRTPLVRSTDPAGKRDQPGGEAAPASRSSVLRRIADILSAGRGVIGIGSPRASLESNFALRSLVGPDSFYSGMSLREQLLVSLIIDVLRQGPARTPSLRDVQAADAVLVLGEDITNTAPLMALAVRQASRNRQFKIASAMRLPLWDDYAVRNAAQDARSPVFIAAPSASRLNDIAAGTYTAGPDGIARLGFAVAHALDPRSPAVPDLPADVPSLAGEIASALRNADRPLVVSGSGCLSRSVVRAAANVAWALCGLGKQAHLSYVVHECNTLGHGLMDSRTLDEAFTVMQDRLADTVIILENDLYRRADREAVDAFLGRAKNVIVIDHLQNPTSARASVVVPAATFAESSGTLVNNEGRAQRYFQVFVPPGDIRAGWEWISDIMQSVGRTGADGPWSFDGIISQLASAIPAFAPIRDIAPTAGHLIVGMKVPRQHHRYSGRTAMNANIDVSEPQPPADPTAPLSFSMEGYEGRPPASLLSRYWHPRWNSVQSLNKFQTEIGGPLRGSDPGTRLIEPDRNRTAVYFTDIPGLRQYQGDDGAAAPRYRIFGSDELSRYAPEIAEIIRGRGSAED